MLVDLILTVCMISNPQSCKEERLSFEARSSLAQCVMLSTPYVAKWAGDHPKWKVRSWKCGWPEQRDQKI
ncbi:hypothetical protein DYI37_13785 [Fulvimarina endophytica]|uniref:Uncharacterized protein n=1 Tax=Fulvimarina endophytica TaxID=2293836 RepID=A0A371X1A5_9HYPH|nr:hypothetical protein [Fulvimarina endophytica]RFC63012.1 hypothetical protein DYI37_13785 [Fulvimarina endophytica]